jgi:hypothetical protein
LIAIEPRATLAVVLVTCIPAGSQARNVDWTISSSLRPHSSRRGRELAREKCGPWTTVIERPSQVVA